MTDTATARTARLAAMRATEAATARTAYAEAAHRTAEAIQAATGDLDAAGAALSYVLLGGSYYADAWAAGYAWLCSDCSHTAAGLIPEWPLRTESVQFGALYAQWEESGAYTDAAGPCDACGRQVGGFSQSGRERYDAWTPDHTAIAWPLIESPSDAAYSLAERDAHRHATETARRQAQGGQTQPTESPLSGEWAGGLTPQELADTAAHAYGHADVYAWTEADTDAPELADALADAWETAYATAPFWTPADAPAEWETALMAPEPEPEADPVAEAVRAHHTAYAEWLSLDSAARRQGTPEAWAAADTARRTLATARTAASDARTARALASVNPWATPQAAPTAPADAADPEGQAADCARQARELARTAGRELDAIKLDAATRYAHALTAAAYSHATDADTATAYAHAAQAADAASFILRRRADVLTGQATA